MEEKPKKSTWGGARRSGVTKKNVTISLDKELAEKLPKNRSAFITQLLKKYFQNKS